MAREERLDLVGAARVAERRERVDDVGGADELAGLLLYLRPVLAHEIPAEITGVRIAEKRRDHQLGILRANVRPYRVLHRATDQRRIRETGQPIQEAIAILGIDGRLR